MFLEILTPEKTVFNGEVEWVTLPGALAPFTVLTNHAPLISSLEKGVLSFSAKGQNIEIEVIDGFVEVNNNRVTVCIDRLKTE